MREDEEFNKPSSEDEVDSVTVARVATAGGGGGCELASTSTFIMCHPCHIPRCDRGRGLLAYLHQTRTVNPDLFSLHLFKVSSFCWSWIHRRRAYEFEISLGDVVFVS